MRFTEQDIEKAKQIKFDGYNWIARDKDGEICAFEVKPYRYALDSAACDMWENQEDTAWITVNKSYFEPITWKSEPVCLDDIIESKTNLNTLDRT